MDFKKNKSLLLLTTFFLILSYETALSSTVNKKCFFTQETQEKILQSPFKALLHRKDGKQFMVYLYAADETTAIDEDISPIDGSTQITTIKSGHFKLYVYDVAQGYFLPQEIAFLTDFSTLRFAVEKPRILILPGLHAGNSDVLLVSQFWTGEGDVYEAYGFAEDNVSLKQYIFNTNKKDKAEEFYGYILKATKTNFIANPTIQTQEFGGFIMLSRDIAVSNTPGEIEITDMKS